MKKTIALLVFLFIGLASYGQTLEELKEAKKQKEDSVSAIQGRIDDLQGQIDEFPAQQTLTTWTILISGLREIP